MTKVFLIHGAYGTPTENWFPWLKKELEKLNCQVFVPKFPTPQNQTLQNWFFAFNSYLSKLDENSIVIGHSLGPAFLMRVLETTNSTTLSKPIKSAFFIAPFIDFLDNPEFDEINRTFIENNFDWKKIKSNCKKFVIYHSDNDPYVNLKYAKYVATKLNVDINIIPNAGHFNQASGYLQFTKLLEDIKKEL
ncbi:serine hydrolase family protein [Candidatus Woesearchaeota archaeon]|jgi:uncharacterized protein|nr:serine hydrolase family protein [Candidatus Woesearchaeota archaeon]